MTVGIKNYTELVESVQAWLGRGKDPDITVFQNINRFINIAEEEITTTLKLLGIKAVLNGKFSPGTYTLEKPAGWRSTISWRVNSSVPVLYLRTTDYIRQVYPLGHSNGVPKYFADYDYTHWMVGPTPDSDYPFQMEMYIMPLPLSEEVQTNWYIDRIPHALLYGTLEQAGLFLKNTNQAAAWREKFMAALGTVKTEDLGTMVAENQRKPK